MREKLTQGELCAFAKIRKVDVALLLRMHDFLDSGKMRQELIRYEFKILGRDKTFRKKQIIAALMKKYGASKSYIELIVYAKRVNQSKECVRCGSAVSRYEWTRNNGVCDRCISRAIKNYELYGAELTDREDTDFIDEGNEAQAREEHLDTIS